MIAPQGPLSPTLYQIALERMRYRLSTERPCGRCLAERRIREIGVPTSQETAGELEACLEMRDWAHRNCEYATRMG